MDYESMKLPELKQLAKERKIGSITGLKKGQIVEKLKAYDDAGKTQAVKKTGDARTDTEKKGSVKRTSERPEEENRTAERKNTESTPQKKQTLRTVEFQRRTRAIPADGQRKSGVEESAGNYHVNRRQENVQDVRGHEKKQAPVKETILMDGTDPLDSGERANGILEIMPEGYGFIRGENYLPSENDIYIAPGQIKSMGLKTGDIISGGIKVRNPAKVEKFRALLYVSTVNGYPVEEISRRTPFEKLTPIFPDERINLENPYSKTVPMRIMDLLAPIGKGQRGMIVSPPKAGKTTLLKQAAISISRNYPDMHLIVLLIDERPEEVTDIRESIAGPNVEVIYSTFDELPDNHKRVSEMVLERAKRLVEHKQDVVILLDSITRLARAYNLTVPPSGRTLTGGLDPAALHMPKKFFGAARNMREGGSLTILATALVETGSKMDDVVFEEFKGTGNMELVLDRKLSEKRIFPAIHLSKSSTRRDDLLLSKEEQETVAAIHRELSGQKSEEATEEILKLFIRTRDNAEFVQLIQKSLVRKH
ncbi:MAG: transcription termination factor Rho [Lachnospiraceae bacterium]|nr:transcription termination factor Rho [Lachnospiraceae bacterium]